MATANQILSETFGNRSFSRNEIWSTLKEHNVPRKEIAAFIDNPENKAARGVYRVAGNTTPAKMTAKQAKETDAEIEARITDRFDILGLMSGGAAIGSTRAFIVSGPPGLGKTHTVMETIAASGKVATCLTGNASAVGLYKALYSTCGRGQVLVIDDCDSVFFDAVALNLLKAACDSTKRRVIRWGTEYSFKGEEVPNEFEFEGSVIFITNLDFDSLIASNNKLSPHVEALMSRAHYLSLAIHSRRDYIVRIKSVVTKMYGKTEATELVAFVEENADNLRELSIRTLVKLSQLRESTSDWKRIAKVTMCLNGK